MHEEELDRLIRDAASQHHPPYDDAAWSRMEQMLDEHLPQKKDRRRPILWLFSFLLLGGAAYWGIHSVLTNNHPNNSNAIAATSSTTSPGNKTETPSTNTVTVNQNPGNDAAIKNPAAQTGSSATNTVTENQPATQGDAALSNSFGVKKYNGRNRITVTNAAIGNDETTASNNNSRKQTQNSRTKTAIKNGNAGADESVTVATNQDDVLTPPAPAANNQPSTNNTITAQEKTPVTTTETVTTTAASKEKTPPVKNPEPATATQNKNNKNKNKFGNRFGITASVGADVAYVELSKTGKLRPSYGGGVTYAIGKHLSISSGVYAAQKVYTALPYQYKFTGTTYNPNLSVIKADCKVIEIPLNVYYSFGEGKKHNWIAGAGLSSLLMKKEDYDYVYVMPNGQSYSYPKYVSNQNKHYFSVLNISAGYQYKISNKVAFVAEPYVKLPLTGIGLGKIKLNSTGVMLSAVIKPFSKKK